VKALTTRSRLLVASLLACNSATLQAFRASPASSTVGFLRRSSISHDPSSFLRSGRHNIGIVSQSARMASTSSSGDNKSESGGDVIPGRPTWHQTMLRIKDPSKSVPFYESLGFTVIDTMDFPQYKFSLYFLTSLPLDGPPYPHKPGTQAAHEFLWNYDGVTLELTHNHGTEADPNQAYHPGNQDNDGFGHIAVKYVT
jgi:lactoylglutathione lyase